MALNRPGAPRVGELAHFLAMDRTTMTANLKPLERRGLLMLVVDEEDKRSRRITLTDAGRDLLVQAVPIWRQTHDDVDAVLGRDDNASLKEDLQALSFG
ncbi:MarR family winged helix-turn-helix transcriptional regulator [Roseobacter sp. A03A-229]